MGFRNLRKDSDLRNVDDFTKSFGCGASNAFRASKDLALLGDPADSFEFHDASARDRNERRVERKDRHR